MEIDTNATSVRFRSYVFLKVDFVFVERKISVCELLMSRSDFTKFYSGPLMYRLYGICLVFVAEKKRNLKSDLLPRF